MKECGRQEKNRRDMRVSVTRKNHAPQTNAFRRYREEHEERNTEEVQKKRDQADRS